MIDLSGSVAGTPSSATGPAGDNLNETRIESLVVQELNRKRDRRDIHRLTAHPGLSSVAGEYAETMAEYGDSGHELGGTTPQQRYLQSDVACRYTGENAAKTWYQTEFDTLSDTYYFANATELANGLISQWMDSQGHRRNMLSERHTAVGVGIEIVEEDGRWAVYAVQDFCA
jgi:uncharacterized protein YkwD